jgi:general secretion pathway protein J
MDRPPRPWQPIDTRRREQGFTLLELLLSITIIALIAVLLLGAFHVGYRAWEKGDAVIESFQRLRGVLELTRRQLTAAVALDVLPEAGPRLDFQGTERALRFISTHSLVPGSSSGRIVVNYRAETGPDGQWRLVFHEQSLLQMDPSRTAEPLPADYVELIGGLAGIRFQYLKADETAGEPVWSAVWNPDADGPLPAAVRLWVQPGPQEVPVGIVARLTTSTRE